MTRLAFGLKWGCLGASGLLLSCAGQPVPAKSWPSAIAPSPTPHFSKNQRRVISVGFLPRYKCDWQFMFSLFRNRFVQIEQRARNNGVSSELRGSGAGGQVLGEGAGAGADFSGVHPAIS